MNETYYLVKAEHFWNPHLHPNDFYCNSRNAHVVFYWASGWLTALGISLSAVAWIGRILTWLLLAIGWWKLCRSVLGRTWWSILAAEFFVLLTKQLHISGEWMIGGVEAKGFAYALALFALDAIVAARWNRALPIFGAATSLHPVVGGWSAVCAAIVWVICSRTQQRLWTIAPGILGAVLLAAPGLWFVAALNRGTDASIVDQANAIQVFERLNHHLLPVEFAPGFVARGLALWGVFLVLCKFAAAGDCDRRLRWFVGSTMILATVGLLVGLVAANVDRESAAAVAVATILRFYWIRLSDVFVPLGVAIVGAQVLIRYQKTRRILILTAVAALIGIAIADLAIQSQHVPGLSTASAATIPPADRFVNDDDWRDVCRWANEHSPQGTVFLTPFLSQTFNWYSGRDEAVTWKNMPQDAKSIVEWRRRLHEAFETDSQDPLERWCESPAHFGTERLRRVMADVRAQYAVVPLAEKQTTVSIEPAYKNSSYAIYQFDKIPSTSRNPENDLQ